MHLAMAAGNTATALVLLQAGANVNASIWPTGQTPQHGSTALHAAASHGNDACVAALLQAGAKANTTDKWGYTALCRAVTFKGCGSEACVSLLLKAGADVNRATKEGKTPLHMAVWGQWETCVVLLLQATTQRTR